MKTETNGQATQAETSAHVASAVIRVSDIDRSLTFYRDVFSCRVVIRQGDTALLLAPNGFQLYLQARDWLHRRSASDVGVQYLTWATDSQSELQRIRQRLHTYDTAVFTHTENGVTFLEGCDPDGTRVIVAYPSPRQLPRTIIAERLRA
ncbi:MAG: VOC family protein [Mycolicibacterium sp.]|nr:VOC family protein [Mycolicibacterium sp.]